MSEKAVLFDLDGTLVDSEPLHFTSMVSVLERHGLVAPPGLENQVTGMTGRECHALLVRETGFGLTYYDYIVAKYAAYLDASPSLLLRSGIAEVLENLTRSETPFAVVSNSDRIVVDANMRAVGLSAPGFVSVSRNDVRNGKPDAEPYLRGAYLLGVDPSGCIVVEDSIPGARAGLAAGMTVIGWPEPHRSDLAFPDGTILADPLDLWSALSGVLSLPAN